MAEPYEAFDDQDFKKQLLSVKELTDLLLRGRSAFSRSKMTSGMEGELTLLLRHRGLWLRQIRHYGV